MPAERTSTASIARRMRGEVPAAAAASGGSLAVAVLALRLWRMDLRVPLTYEGDALIAALPIQTAIERGWYETTPRLGAPTGHVLYDLPAFVGDHLQILVLKWLGQATDWATAMNLWFLAGFVLITLGAHVALRLRGVSRASAVVCAVLYAVLPYHFLRGENHLFLSLYAMVPLACVLSLWALEGHGLFSDRAQADSRARRIPGPRTAGSAGIAVLLALTGAYYALITVMLLLVAAALWAARRDRKRAFEPLVVSALILFVLGLNSVPTLLHRVHHGSNPLISVRPPGETEYYALKLTDLVLPQAAHRLSAARRVRARYEGGTPAPATEARFGALGTVGTIGMVILAAVAASTLAGGRRPGPLRRRLRVPALAAGVLFALGTVGGLSSLIAFYATPQLHSMNRVAIFIAFLCLLAIATALDLILRRSRRAAGAGLLATVLLLGVADETNDSFVPAYTATQAGFRSDARFFGAIEHSLPLGASVYQLPYRSFPESPPPFRMDIYDDLRGYLHTSELRWSAANMRARTSDWQAALAGIPPVRLLPRLTAAGFDGVTLDHFGYQDSGRAMERTLDAALGPPALTSPDGRFTFYHLRALSAVVAATAGRAGIGALRDSALRPLQVRPGAGLLLSSYAADQRITSTLNGPSGSLRITNPLATPRRARLTLGVWSPSGKPAELTLASGGRPLRTATLGRQQLLATRLTIAPGKSDVHVEVRRRDAADGPIKVQVRFVSMEEIVGL